MTYLVVFSGYFILYFLHKWWDMEHKLGQYLLRVFRSLDVGQTLYHALTVDYIGRGCLASALLATGGLSVRYVCSICYEPATSLS